MVQLRREEMIAHERVSSRDRTQGEGVRGGRFSLISLSPLCSREHRRNVFTSAWIFDLIFRIFPFRGWPALTPPAVHSANSEDHFPSSLSPLRPSNKESPQWRRLTGQRNHTRCATCPALAIATSTNWFLSDPRRDPPTARGSTTCMKRPRLLLTSLQFQTKSKMKTTALWSRTFITN